MIRAPEISVRDATELDAAAIGEVARASWHATYGEIYLPEFIDDFWARNYSTEALERSIARAREDAGRHFLVAERDGEVVGYLHFGPGQHGPELYRLYARPDQFGTGIGDALITELETRLSGVVDRYILYVHARNDRGRRFYERQQFTEVGRRTDSDDDLMLEKRLGGYDERNSSTSES